MNDRQRFLAVLSFRSADRIPNYELALWGQTIERWETEGMPSDACWHNWFEGEPHFRLERRGFAHISTRMIPPFEHKVLSEDERTVTARNANGIVTRALKEGTARGTRASMDQYLSFPVTDRASFREIKKRYDPSSPTRYPLWWDTQVLAWRKRDYPLCLLGNASIGLYSQLRSWCGTEGISYLFYDDPALVEEMVELTVDFIIHVTERARKEVRFDYFSFFEDFAGKGGPLLSPDLFRRFLLGGYRRIIGEFRKSGIEHYWLDSDGDPRPLVPLMIDAGITCLWPLEVAAGIEPEALRRQYGRNLALAGGIDKRELARSREHIERELLRRIPPLLDRGGYIPHLDHAVPPDVSYDNFRYYLDLKMKLLGY